MPNLAILQQYSQGIQLDRSCVPHKGALRFSPDDWTVDSVDSQGHADQGRELGPAGWIERDVAPTLIDVDQEEAERVDHDDRLEVQQALQEDESLDVVGVRRLRA